MKTKPLLFGLLSVIALGIGVYGINTLSGNQTEEQARCAAGSDHAATLGETALGEVAAYRALDVPVDVSSISFVDADGNPKTIADWNGKTVLFNLWATWCPPCREEMPYFEELQVTKGGDKFEVVPVSIDLGDDVKPKAFYEETGLKELPFFHDNTMQSFESLKSQAIALGMPTTLIIDQNGCGLGVLNGPAQWASPDAVRLIDKALELAENS